MEKVAIYKIIIILLVSGSIQCGSSTLCGDNIMSEVKSPSDKYLATLFERNCGATTDFSRVVNIRLNGSKFIAGDGIVFLVQGQHKINVLWVNDSTLQIECDSCAPDVVFKEENRWNGVDVFIDR